MKRCSIDDDSVATLLDRLVCEELSASQRSELLRWLESDPIRWRKCALAFLEAQAWRKALKMEPAAASALPMVLAPTVKAKKVAQTWLAVAAAALVAFGFGWSGALWSNHSRGISTNRNVASVSQHQGSAKVASTAQSPDSEGQTKPLFASFSLAGSDSKAQPAELKLPVRMDAGASPADEVVFSEYERKKWERHGFRVSRVREYAPGKLPDGKPVVLSVDRVRVERIGVPTI